MNQLRVINSLKSDKLLVPVVAKCSVQRRGALAHKKRSPHSEEGAIGCLDKEQLSPKAASQ